MATTKDIPDGSAPKGLGLTEAELATARKEGAKEDAKEAAKDSHRYLTDGQNLGEPVGRQWTGHDEIMQFAPALDLSVEDFEKRIAKNSDTPLPEEKIYGLLALERNGRNRTPYVKAAMKRLGLKADELPGGGPAYTNDLTSITDL
jgi:hypothetical protein